MCIDYSTVTVATSIAAFDISISRMSIDALSSKSIRLYAMPVLSSLLQMPITDKSRYGTPVVLQFSDDSLTALHRAYSLNQCSGPSLQLG